ncbi:hypothetical protein CBL_09999 [Carabus blaptoides fortunei]
MQANHQDVRELPRLADVTISLRRSGSIAASSQFQKKFCVSKRQDARKDPTTVKEALAETDNDKWRAAMLEELENLRRIKTWTFGREWNLKLPEFLKSSGLKRSQADPCESRKIVNYWSICG